MVSEYVRRAHAAGLRWPLPETLDEDHLYHLLFPQPAPASQRLIRNYYDSSGHNEGDLYNIITRFHYDAVGNLVDLIDTENTVTHFEYDEANQLTGVVENYRPGFSANADTNVRTEFRYDEGGNPIAVIDRLDRITRTYYDQLNRPVRVVQNLSGWDLTNTSPPPFDLAHPDENVPTVYTYDAAGRLIEIEDPLGTVSHACYDARGLPLKSVLNPSVGDPCSGYIANGASDRDVTQSWTFDGVGNLKTSSDPLGRITTFDYDPLYRLATITDPLGFVTGFGYDALGNRISMTDAEGVVTRYGYDPLNRLDEVVQNYQSSGPTDHQTNVQTTYAYDPVGNLLRVTDAVGSEWSYTYNGLDRLIGEDDALGHTWEYDYSAVGELTHRTDPKGFTTLYSYNELNRLVGIDYPGPDPDVSLALDALGNPLSMLDGLGETTWAYDGLYRPIAIDDPFGGVVGYDYDAVGNRVGITYPDSKSVAYDYDLAQRLTRVTDWDSGETTYTYDKAGQPLSASLPNGITSSFEWDADGRLTTLEHNFNTSTLASYSYGYDRLGNRTHAEELIAVPEMPPAGPYVLYLPIVGGNGTGPSPDTIDYEYDPLYRLTAADYSSGTYFHYTYDAVGNRLTQETEQGSNAYGYDAAHRLIEVDGQTYTWDDNGNLLDDGERTFSYDHADRLVAVSGLPSAFSFSYDGLGNRYQQTVDAATTTFSLDLAAGLTQVLSDGNNASLYGLGRIGEDGSGGWGYHLADALGSVRQIANDSGKLTLTQSFEPFGAPMISTGDGSSGFGFTGEQDAAGLVFLRARFYDPEIGRFLTKDPFSGYASSPSTLNPYTYALNNPTTLVDPSGQNPLLIAAAVGALIGMVGGAVSYMISNPGADLGDMLNSACFWKSVVIGGITGAVSGLFTGFLGGLGILGTNFIQTVVLGAFTGFISGGVGEGVNQLLTFGKITNWNAVLGSAITGAITGAIFSLVGYGIGKVFRRFRSSDSSGIFGGDDWLDHVRAENRAAVKSAFEGTPSVETLSDDLIVYRHWGGKSSEVGSPWFSIKKYIRPGNARRYLALPPGNTAKNVTRFLIPRGTTIIKGKVASQIVAFGEYAVGRGTQVYISDPWIAILLR